MGWEYFNGRPGGKERPWEWAQEMTKILRTSDTGIPAAAQEPLQKPLTSVVDDNGDDDEIGSQPPLPRSFEYDTDGSTTRE